MESLIILYVLMAAPSASVPDGPVAPSMSGFGTPKPSGFALGLTPLLAE